MYVYGMVSLSLCVFTPSLQDEIISKLKYCLLVKNRLAYEPLLDLLVQMARDLQLEFYPYFKEMFPILVGMCDCQDADLIQVCVQKHKLTVLRLGAWCLRDKRVCNLLVLASLNFLCSWDFRQLILRNCRGDVMSSP